MLFTKPIKTRRTQSASNSSGVRLVVFPTGIQVITPAQKAVIKKAAKTLNLTRGFAEIHNPEDEIRGTVARKR